MERQHLEDERPRKRRRVDAASDAASTGKIDELDSDLDEALPMDVQKAASQTDEDDDILYPTVFTNPVTHDTPEKKYTYTLNRLVEDAEKAEREELDKLKYRHDDSNEEDVALSQGSFASQSATASSSAFADSTGNFGIESDEEEGVKRPLTVQQIEEYLSKSEKLRGAIHERRFVRFFVQSRAHAPHEPILYSTFAWKTFLSVPINVRDCKQLFEAVAFSPCAALGPFRCFAEQISGSTSLAAIVGPLMQYRVTGSTVPQRPTLAWLPRKSDFLRVLCEYGAEIGTVTLSTSSTSVVIPIPNFCLVMNLLALCLAHRRELFTDVDVDDIVIVLFRCAIDPSVRWTAAIAHISGALGLAVDSYSLSEWTDERAERMCTAIVAIGAPSEDFLALVNAIPATTARQRMFRTRLGLTLIHTLVPGVAVAHDYTVFPATIQALIRIARKLHKHSTTVEVTVQAAVAAVLAVLIDGSRVEIKAAGAELKELSEAVAAWDSSLQDVSLHRLDITELKDLLKFISKTKIALLLREARIAKGDRAKIQTTLGSFVK